MPEAVDVIRFWTNPTSYILQEFFTVIRDLSPLISRWGSALPPSLPPVENWSSLYYLGIQACVCGAQSNPYIVTHGNGLVAKCKNIHFKVESLNCELFVSKAGRSAALTFNKSRNLNKPSAWSWTKYPSVRAMVWESTVFRTLAAVVPGSGIPFNCT